VVRTLGLGWGKQYWDTGTVLRILYRGQYYAITQGTGGYRGQWYKIKGTALWYSGNCPKLKGAIREVSVQRGRVCWLTDNFWKMYYSIHSSGHRASVKFCMKHDTVLLEAMDYNELQDTEKSKGIQVEIIQIHGKVFGNRTKFP
jgi:hypothetical protein